LLWGREGCHPVGKVDALLLMGGSADEDKALRPEREGSNNYYESTEDLADFGGVRMEEMKQSLKDVMQVLAYLKADFTRSVLGKGG